MDSSKWPSYSAPDAELQALLKTKPPPPSFSTSTTAPQLRAAITSHFMSQLTAGILLPISWRGYSKTTISIPTRDGAALRAVVYKPKVRKGALLVYFHGGGWTFGVPEAGEAGFEPLVKELGICVVSVGYRVAPENVFPCAAHDAVDAVGWCAKNAETVGADMEKGFIISGSSAGANIAAVAAHQAVDEGFVPKLTGVVLMAPVMVHSKAVPEKWREHYRSWEEHRDALVLDRKGMDWFDEQYQPDPESPLASPLLWHTHKGQPKTYMQVYGADPLRDDALIYEHVLKEVGVETNVDIYPGIPHAGGEFMPMHSVAKKAVADLKKGVQWILEEQ